MFWYSISKLTGIICYVSTEIKPPNLLNGRSLIDMISFSTFHLEMWWWFVSTHFVKPSIIMAKLYRRNAFIDRLFLIFQMHLSLLLSLLLLYYDTWSAVVFFYVLRFKCFTMKSNYAWSILGGFGFNLSIYFKYLCCLICGCSVFIHSFGLV